MTYDRVTLCAFLLCVLLVCAAAFRRIDWFGAAIAIVVVFLFLALFGNHWQG